MLKGRLDKRSVEQFTNDIKKSSKIELQIALRLCCYYRNITGRWPKLSPMGTDYTGKFVEDKDVKTLCDFKINDKFIEITSAYTICNKVFHQKKAKAERCANGEYIIIFVNGFGKMEEPQFCVLTPKVMQSLLKISKKKYGEVKHPSHGSGVVDKPAYRFDLEWIEDWKILPELNEDIPEDYNFEK